MQGFYGWILLKEDIWKRNEQQQNADLRSTFREYVVLACLP